ncbi:MAG: carboxypeptidase regulatory-like domain-containing protein [Chloracidobacterium sp.]|nr:carboxypeptidase regulatory-like domain-containing protein [Chloracidobacterium sp.]
MRAKLLTGPLFILLALVSASAAFGQATGGLSGTVKDPNNAVVPGASVTVRNTGTNLTRAAITNDEGRWTIIQLPVGIYTVSYEKDGFKKAVSQPTDVEALVTRTVDVTLEVGVSDVFVDVTAEQPLIQTESAAVARQITGEQLIRTPTSVRSFTGLLSSEAGVSSELSPVGVASAGNISPSVNGTRTTSTSLFSTVSMQRTSPATRAR